jgi:hypothetical protein
MTSSPSSLLLPEVMSKVANLSPASLAAVNRFLSRLELAQLSEEIQDEAELLREAGKLEDDLIDSAVREHRNKHPYDA